MEFDNLEDLAVRSKQGRVVPCLPYSAGVQIGSPLATIMSHQRSKVEDAVRIFNERAYEEARKGSDVVWVKLVQTNNLVKLVLISLAEQAGFVFDRYEWSDGEGYSNTEFDIKLKFDFPSRV